MDALNAEVVELCIESHAAASRFAAKDGGVVAQEASWSPVLLDRGIEAVECVCGLDGWEGDRGQAEPRVVIDQVEDLDFAGVGQVPLGGVGLPELVGQLSLEADE